MPNSMSTSYQTTKMFDWFKLKAMADGLFTLSQEKKKIVVCKST